MKKPNSIERIVNSFGWKTTNGKVEYRGFEHLLNKDLPDWRHTEEFEDDPVLAPVEVEPEVAEVIKRNQVAHNELLEAQKRVDKLKAKAKAVKK